MSEAFVIALIILIIIVIILYQRSTPEGFGWDYYPPSSCINSLLGPEVCFQNFQKYNCTTDLYGFERCF